MICTGFSSSHRAWPATSHQWMFLFCLCRKPRRNTELLWKMRCTHCSSSPRAWPTSPNLVNHNGCFVCLPVQKAQEEHGKHLEEELHSLFKFSQGVAHLTQSCQSQWMFCLFACAESPGGAREASGGRVALAVQVLAGRGPPVGRARDRPGQAGARPAGEAGGLSPRARLLQPGEFASQGTAFGKPLHVLVHFVFAGERVYLSLTLAGVF